MIKLLSCLDAAAEARQRERERWKILLVMVKNFNISLYIKAETPRVWEEVSYLSEDNLIY